MPALLKTTQIQEPSSASVNLTLDANGNGTFAGTAVMSSPYTMRNKIINGAMVIDQRNAGASVTGSSTANVFPVDRWFNTSSQNSKLTLQQNAGSVTPPSGFRNYVGVTSSSAYSVLTGDSFTISHRIEGYNAAELMWGSASAQTVTLSFWVRSSLTGTFGGAFGNNAINRSYPFTYTISSANTWEQKTITVVGDTTGTWETTNLTGISIYFGLGAGSTYSGTAGSWAAGAYLTATGATSVVGTNGATFYITGVQLERGTVATPFEYRNYQQELAMCQRYFQIAGSGGYGSFDNSTTTIQMTEKLIIPMRTQPTGAIRSGVTAAFRSSGSDFTAASPALANFTTNPSAIGDGIAFWTQVTGFTGGTSNAVANSRNNQVTNGGAFINLSAEL